MFLLNSFWDSAAGAAPNGLADVITPQPVTAMAFWNLYPASYAGSCLQIVRSSDGATQDIGFSGGVLDTAAIASFCGSSDGRIGIWYDQTDGSAGVTYATTPTRSKIYDGATGQMVTDDDGDLAWPQNGSSIPILRNTASSATFTIMCAFSTTDTQFVVIGAHATNTRYLGLGQSGSTSTIVCNKDGSFSVGRHFKNGVEQSVANRGEMYTRFATGSPLRYVGVANHEGSGVLTGSPTLGVYDSNAGHTISMSNEHFKGYCIQYTAALTDLEIANVDAYLAANIP